MSTPLERPSSSEYRSAVRSWKRATAPVLPVFSRSPATMRPPAARAAKPASGMVRRILPCGTGLSLLGIGTLPQALLIRDRIRLLMLPGWRAGVG
ncbi:hypothetical protein LAUMK41_03468 [Mycobacterium attenuatum]|nr:hypothetical protein LAUMK41_03468 [Mycobacterium attenuatum]